jgi:hypothetical protein
MWFKNSDFKMYDLKKLFWKTQLSVYQNLSLALNRRLAFKIISFQKSTTMPTIWKKKKVFAFSIAILKRFIFWDLV